MNAPLLKGWAWGADEAASCTPVRMFEPLEDVPVSVLILAGVSAEFDRRADRLAADLAAYRARCDAALARIQESTPC